MMKLSLCHYSYHRTWVTKNWNCTDMAIRAKELGFDGIDFHVRYLTSPVDAPEQIRAALKKAGLELSGLSLSNDFTKADLQEYKNEIQTAIGWLRTASDVKAPVVRIFGGYVADRSDKDLLANGYKKVVDAIGQVVKEAEKLGVVLGLENHGCLPGTAEEQVEIITKIKSPSLRATVDVGNYMMCGQDGHVGTAIAAPYAAYVHLKDFIKRPNTVSPWGRDIHPCILGEGAVNHAECLNLLKKNGYNGFVALEYEGPVDEEIAVPQSIEYMKKLMRG